MIIDAHQHFWKYNASEYGWIDDRMAVLKNDFLPNKLKKHLETAKREILNLVTELDSEALKAILKIEEPETFKIGEDNIGKDILDKLTK